MLNLKGSKNKSFSKLIAIVLLLLVLASSLMYGDTFNLENGDTCKANFANGASFILRAEIGKVSGQRLEEAVNGLDREIRLEAIDFSSTGYNALREAGIKDIILNLSNDSSVEDERERIKQGSELNLSLQEHRIFLKEIADKAGLQGRVLYYPFGGFDPYTAFMLVDSATDVISVGLESFGSIENIRKFFENGRVLEKAGIRYSGFDTAGTLDRLITQYKLDGLGVLAISRIISFLDGEIEGLYYFVLENDGAIRFLKEGEMDRPENCKNAVIEFRDKNTSKLKRYWYIQEDMCRDNMRFSSFIGRLGFQVLIIKGAVYMGKENIEQEERKRIIQKTLEPAKRNNARIIADKHLWYGEDRSRFDYYMRPIWKAGTVPGSIELEGRQQFGYSRHGGFIFYGPAEWLIDSDTSKENILIDYTPLSVTGDSRTDL